jgi:hypothetical protein
MQKQSSMAFWQCKGGFCGFSTFCRGTEGEGSIRQYGASRISGICRNKDPECQMNKRNWDLGGPDLRKALCSQTPIEH